MVYKIFGYCLFAADEFGEVVDFFLVEDERNISTIRPYQFIDHLDTPSFVAWNCLIRFILSAQFFVAKVFGPQKTGERSSDSFLRDWRQYHSKGAHFFNRFF